MEFGDFTVVTFLTGCFTLFLSILVLDAAVGALTFSLSFSFNVVFVIGASLLDRVTNGLMEVVLSFDFFNTFFSLLFREVNLTPDAGVLFEILEALLTPLRLLLPLVLVLMLLLVLLLFFPFPLPFLLLSLSLVLNIISSILLDLFKS